jgi:hypothetical protein
MAKRKGTPQSSNEQTFSQRPPAVIALYGAGRKDKRGIAEVGVALLDWLLLYDLASRAQEVLATI